MCWKKLLGKSCLPLFSVLVPSECAVSGVCSFNANKLLPIAYKWAVTLHSHYMCRWRMSLICRGHSRNALWVRPFCRLCGLREKFRNVHLIGQQRIRRCPIRLRLCKHTTVMLLGLCSRKSPFWYKSGKHWDMSKSRPAWLPHPWTLCRAETTARRRSTLLATTGSILQ